MNKKRTILIFISILVLILLSIIYNSNFRLEKEVYVVSPKEEEKDMENIKKDEQFNNEDYKVPEKEIDSKKLRDIKVYISGQVKMPGVISISEEGRLIDAVEKLGGLTSEADLNRINLAMKLEDGNHYIIPKVGEDTNINQSNVYSDNSNKPGETTNTDNEKVNINNADSKLLDTLPGVGESTAQKIIDYREQSGGFSSIDEIKNVNGIGDKKFEELKNYICVE